MTGWRWSRILGALLVVSLGANLFLGGWIAGRAFLPHPPPPPPPGPGGMLERLTRHLSPEDAAILRGAFEPDTGMRERQHAFHARVAALLRSEPFDPQALAAAFAADHAARADLGQKLAAAAARLSPEGRRRLADESERMR